MSTVCAIGIKEDNNMKFISCHFDGYPKGAGAILHAFYTDSPKVRDLIRLGNISTLGKYVNPNKEFEHSFRSPQSNTVIAYHRDRGEPYKRPKVVTKLNQVNFGEWLYIWIPEEGKWLIYRKLGGWSFYTVDFNSPDYVRIIDNIKKQ